MSIIDLKAAKKWKQVPKDLRRKIINNVFCGECFVTTIVDYTLYDDPHGVLLEGKCKNCGKDVARLVEDI